MRLPLMPAPATWIVTGGAGAADEAAAGLPPAAAPGPPAAVVLEPGATGCEQASRTTASIPIVSARAVIDSLVALSSTDGERWNKASPSSPGTAALGARPRSSATIAMVIPGILAFGRISVNE